MSLAEAKLARQNQRIEQAEAAMNAPIPPDKERLVSRIKGKAAWKPFDFAADTISSGQGGESIAPVETRINTFRAPPTRDNSLSRSMSSLSQRTTGTLPSDMERQDSAQADVGGFQLYVPRKSRKNVEQLNAYEDKPEQKQTTVEAPVDTREIYEVFGNALPSLDFIHQNPGAKDGQLQFVQHPNGDVAAHQWSMERYVWENIGQFSNIRKKIEGQLAADRLKGETEYQTVQQHKLAYFRTIAKQREANAMGLPFGQKEIQTLLPDLRPPQPPLTAPKAPKAWTVAAEAAMSEASGNASGKTEDAAALKSEIQSGTLTDQQYSYEAYTDHGSQPAYGGYGGYCNLQRYPFNSLYRAPTAPRADRYNNNFFYGAPSQGLHDPFYSHDPIRSVYGGLPGAFGGQYARTTPAYAPSSSYFERPQALGGQSAKAMAYGSLSGYTEKGQQTLNYDYHFPPPGTGSKPAESSAVTEALKHSQRQSSTLGSATHDFSGPHVNADDTQNIRLAAPIHSRTAMHEQLVRLGDQAKARSLSQDKIRTVLHDPFRSHPDTASEAKNEPALRPAEVTKTVAVTPTTTWEPQGVKGTGANRLPTTSSRSRLDRSPELKKTVANPSGLPPGLQPPAMLQPTAPSFNAAVGSAAKMTPVGSVENFKSISYSSPDPHWSKKDTDSVAEQEAKLKDLLAGSTAAEPECTAKKHSPPGKKTYDEQLKTWWYNGNTFARHEDMYNSMMGANRSTATDDTSNATPSLAPIGTPANRSTASNTYNTTSTAQEKGDAMTRMLIPVWENLASYVQGPIEKRRDYFSPWTQAPEYAIDRSDNTSFYDKEWGQPPVRVGRDPLRYHGPAQQQSPRYGGEVGRFGSAGNAGAGVENVRFGGFSSPTTGSSLAVGAGLERRFAFGRT